jgi:hypothetical protein
LPRIPGQLIHLRGIVIGPDIASRGIERSAWWKMTTLTSQARVRSPLLWLALLALLGPLLACSGLWVVAASPGPPHTMVLPLLPGRTLEVNFRPCDPTEPGRMMIWYIDSTRANRFIRERFILLMRTTLAPACPVEISN